MSAGQVVELLQALLSSGEGEEWGSAIASGIPVSKIDRFARSQPAVETAFYVDDRSSAQ
jgi:hypothetical protein